MVKNLENYDELRQLGAAPVAGMRGLDHAYPPNLLDAESLAYEAWDSLTQATVANCWLKANILPLQHATQLRQDSGRFHQQYSSSAIQDFCALFKSTTFQLLDERADLQPIEQRKLGDLQSLCVQSNEDPDGFAESLETWLTIEDDEMVRLYEIEMVMEEEKQCTSHEECHTVLESTSDPPTDSESGTHTDDESNKELSEVNRKGILNSTDLDESLRMV